MTLKKPNILLIMVDQMRYDSLGCYGNECVKTPHLDSMADSGVVFDNHYVNSPFCTPTRSSLHTGKPLPGHGVYKLYDNLPLDEVLFPKRLKEIGYNTALVGKLHVSSRVTEEKGRHLNDGFDYYHWCHDPTTQLHSEFNAYSNWLQKNHPDFFRKLENRGKSLKNFPSTVHQTHWASTETINLIDQWPTEDPFFIEMSVFDPHNPYYDYPVEALELVDIDSIDEHHNNYVDVHKEPAPIKRERNNSPLGPVCELTSEDLREIRLGYYASVSFFDQEFGRLLEFLRGKGLERDTLIIFTSDHGDMLGDHNLLGKGAFFYDPTTKVPLIIKWPGNLEMGRRVKKLTQPQDITATILGAAGYGCENTGQRIPEAFNLLEFSRGNKEKARQFATCLYRNTGINKKGRYYDPPIFATMIRDSRYKLNFYHDLSFSRKASGELFDLDRDPYETQNLWDEASLRKVKENLISLLLDWEVSQELKRGSRGGENLPWSA